MRHGFTMAVNPDQFDLSKERLLIEILKYFRVEFQLTDFVRSVPNEMALWTKIEKLELLAPGMAREPLVAFQKQEQAT